MEKLKRYLLIFFSIFIFLFLTETCYSLGATPARVDINFYPGAEKTIVYNVLEDNNEKELEIIVDGDLAEYVKLDKKTLVGSDSFKAVLKLPEYIEKPGEHKIFVWIKEKIDEELVGDVGTSVNVGVLIVVDVPLPGRYVELELESDNVNVGEPVNFALKVISKGTEIINITPQIEIVSQNNLNDPIETLYFQERELKSQDVLKLKKSLDTTGYNPGKYKATALVEYGKLAKAEADFRIGDLIIYMINHTNEIVIEKIKPFDVEIESGWNNQIDGAYAHILIFNNSKVLADFKTSSTSLTPWERKTITGFFDTSNFTKGIYDANITLIYYGKERGESVSELVKVEFVEKTNEIIIVLIIVGIVILLAAIFFVIRYFIKKKK
ncbi:MAG: hypothetical protein ABH811_03075 [archaeon]